MEKISTNKHWQQYWQSKDHQPLVVHQELLDNLLSVVDVNGKRILEIGVGMGGDSIFLAKRGAKVTALDFTKEALAEVKKNALLNHVKINTIQADAKAIPCPDETFDIVFHQGFLEHFTNPQEMLIEQKRVLKRGGYLLIDVPQRYTTYTIKKHLLMMQNKWFAGWEREFSIGELENLLRRAGLHTVKSYGWGYYGKLYAVRHLGLGTWYESLWRYIENGRLHLYLHWCVGVIAKKP